MRFVLGPAGEECHDTPNAQPSKRDWVGEECLSDSGMFEGKSRKQPVERGQSHPGARQCS